MGRRSVPIRSAASFSYTLQLPIVTRKVRTRPMLNEWRPINEFPNYSVSSEGFVRNDESGRRMALLVNQHGIVNVGLTKNRVQYKRAVALLVAIAFDARGQVDKSFDCPVNLDGDRFNNRIDNLVWRPRWFATKYFQQIEEAHFVDPYPIEEMNTQMQFKNPWDAALKCGLLQVDVLLSIANGTRVWPTGQIFKPLR